MSFDSEYLELRKKRKKQEETGTKKVVSRNPLNDELMDIAPVRFQSTLNAVTQQKKPRQKANEPKLDFFKTPEAFKDGYNIGDVTKTILGTAGDIAVGAARGFAHTVEGAGDLISYGIAGASDLFGNYDFADSLRAEAKKDLTEKLLGKQSEIVSKNSVLGRTSQGVTEMIGQLATMGATGGASELAGLGKVGSTILTTGVLGTSATGSGMSEAYQSGATDEEALTYGVIAGTVESISEMIFGGLGKSFNAVGFSSGLSSADDILAKKLTSKLTSQIAKNCIEYGIKAGAEGFEEVLAGVGQSVGKKLTYMSEKELAEIVKDENLLEQFVVGAIGSGFAQSVDLYNANKSGTDFITDLTQDEQAVVDKEVENRVAEKEADGKKLTNREKNKIYDAVIKDLDKGYISTDTIEEVLGGKTYKSYKDTIDNETALQDEFNTLNKMKQSEMTGEQTDRRAELKQKLEELKNNSNKTQLKEQLSNDVFNLVKGSRLVESYNETARRGQTFEADLSKYDAKQQEVVKKAVESGILNNTNRTHEFVDMVAKISADKGVLFDFSNNEKIKESGFAVDGKTVNGYVDGNGNISLNIDSSKALNSVVGHEITHILEGTELHDALKDVVKQYATTKGEYDTRLQTLSKLYEGVDGANIENELTADLIGDYLFTDSDFINKLSTESRNVFKKIYDEIKYLCKIATAGSKEARELERVKRAFEKAYKESANTKAKSDTKYSLSDSEGRNLTKEQAEYFKDSKVRDAEGNLIPVYHGTFEDFTVFDINKTANANIFGKGHYFTNSEKDARNNYATSEGADVKTKIESLAYSYFEEMGYTEEDLYDNGHIDEWNEAYDRAEAFYESGKVMQVYLNITNPVYADKYQSLYDKEGNFVSARSIEGLKELGFDGIIDYHASEKFDFQHLEEETAHYVVFDSNQIKNIDNQNPTKDEDIRYSLSEDERKQAQYELIQEANPKDESINKYATWIDKPSDVRTFREALEEDGGYWDGVAPDFTADDIQKALKSGYVTVYSTYPIKNGVFVSPSRMEAESYGVRDKIHSKRVALTDVAWIDAGQGQYAKVDDNVKYSLSDIDRYTEKQYNDYGWVKVHDVLTGNELTKLYSQFSDIKNNKFYGYRNRKGEYLIPVGDEYDTYDHIVYISGTNKHPKISQVIGFVDKSIDSNLRTNYFMEVLNNESINHFDNSWEIVEAYAGQQLFRQNEISNYETYSQVRNRARRQARGRIDTGNRGWNNRTGIQEEGRNLSPIANNNEIEVASNEATFSNAQKQFSLYKDSDGRELSKAQQKFFKDSKTRDENGNLKVMYHGTSKGGYTVFDTYGSNYGLFGQGSYFTDNKSVAESYTNKGKGNNKQVYEVYLNITNPIDMDADADVNAWQKALPDADFSNCTTNEDCYRAMEEYFEDEQYSKYEASEIAIDTIQSMGYDGITHIGGGRVNADGTRHQVYIAFEPEQIKNIDNIAPTKDADIRYSLSEDSKDRVFYTPFGVEVVQNPTDAEYRQMREDIYNAYPHLRGTGEGILRHTYDEEGNVYYWNAYDGMHSSVEPYINKHYNTRTSQHWEWWKRDDKDDYPTDYSHIRYSLSPAELDKQYLSAVKNGDMETAQRMVIEYAKENGYATDDSWKMQHKAPNSKNDVSLYNLKESGLVPDDYWEHPEWYTYSPEERESHYKVKHALEVQEKRTKEGNPRKTGIWVYRAVDKTKNTKEGDFRNGDWVTPSYDYAVNEGKDNPNGYRIIKHWARLDHLYWDGNSIAELGYDDGNNYAYADTTNNRKLLDAVTYDDDDNIIPLSKRFKRRKWETNYSLSREDATPDKSDKFYGEYLKYTPTEEIAPVGTVAENTTVETVPTQEVVETTDIPDGFAPLTEEEANAIREEGFSALNDMDAPIETRTEPYYIADTTRLDDKTLKNISSILKDALSLNKAETKAIQDIVQNYSTSETQNTDDLFNEIKDRFGEKAWTERNEEIAEVKQTLRNYKLRVSPTIKGDIADYSDFMRRNFGKLVISKNGMPVDTAYMELSATYPEFFPPDVTNATDQLLKMSEVANMDINESLTAVLDDETIQEATDIISDIVNTYKENAIRQGVEADNQSYLTQLDRYFELLGEGKSEAIKPRPEKLVGEEEQWAKNKMARADKVKGNAEQTAKIITDEPKVEKKKNRAWSKFVSNFVDKASPFETLALKTGNREVDAKFNTIRYAEGKAQNLIGKGAEGVKALNDIIAEVKADGLTDSLYEYLYHKHNVDRMTLEDRYKDVPNKAVFGDSVTAKVSQDIVEQYEFAEPKLVEYANEIYNYNRHLRKMLVDGGVISQETADLWEEMYPHYVPIRREGDDGLNINVPLDTGRTGVNAPIKRATGGSRDILPLFDTMAQRTIQTYKAIAKNRFGVELKNTLGTTVENAETNLDEVIDSIDTQESLLQEGKNGRNPTFTVFENGEKITFEITEEMYDALKPTSEGLAYTNKALNTINNVRRGLLTEYNPTFMLTNAVKDAQDVLINSQHPARTYKNFPKAIKELATKGGKWYSEYMKNGGEQNTYFEKDTNAFKEEKTGFAKLIGLPLDKISDANNFIERIPRLAEYIASREMGRSIDVAMLDSARVTTNFSAGGDVTKFLNRNGATFLNASIQGAVQQVRNVREAKYNGLKGWVQLGAKTMLAGLPALLLNGLLWDDDEEYEELSDYVKENYYIVAKFGDGKFVRIPKGRAVAVIQNAFEQTWNALTGDDEVDLNRFLELAISNLAPNNPLDNNVIAPIMQVANNETWYGEDLVPTRLQDLPNAEQYDESTDAISKWLGEKLNYSPYKINYLLDQYSGGIGDMVLPMLTPEAESGNNSFSGNLLAPIKDKFTTDSVMNNQVVSDFYKTSDELTTNAKSSKATDEDILKYKYINSVQTEMGELYAEKREIQNSNLSDEIKYKKVREIQEEINALSENALNTYGTVNIDGNYANVGDRHYRLNDENEWQKINDKQLAKQEEVTSGLGITPAEYWNNKAEYDYAYDSPEKYAVAKAVGGYSAYKTYSSELYDIHADKDSNGKSISGSRKEKVLDYINNLDIDYYEKLILFKSEYNADDTYNYEIIDYLNNRDDISYEEEVIILKELGFNVDSNGNISW